MQKYRVWIAYFFYHNIDEIIHPFVFISLVVFFSFLFSGPFKILYVTPERLAKSKRFMNALQKCYMNKQLNLIAVDEGIFGFNSQS